jgi:hypothetical protein
VNALRRANCTDSKPQRICDEILGAAIVVASLIDLALRSAIRDVTKRRRERQRFLGELFVFVRKDG